MGKALAYGLSNWERLGEYLRDGRIEIDNNLAESRPVERPPEEEAADRLAAAERRQNVSGVNATPRRVHAARVLRRLAAAARRAGVRLSMTSGSWMTGSLSSNPAR